MSTKNLQMPVIAPAFAGSFVLDTLIISTLELSVAM